MAAGRWQQGGHFCCQEGKDINQMGRGRGDLSLRADPEHVTQSQPIGKGCWCHPSIACPKAGDPTEREQLGTGRVKANKTRAGSLTGAKDSRGK